MQMEDGVVQINLLFVRHGETQHNKERIIAGHQPGKLTALGISQAERVGKYFDSLKQAFDAIYVSDLQRTKDTFHHVLQKAPHLAKTPAQYTDLLREKKGGVLQNKPLSSWAQASKEAKTPIRQFKPQSGESWKDVMQRCRLFLQQIVEQHHLSCEQGKKANILAVSHGGYIMQFHNVCNLLCGQSQIYDNSGGNCSINQFLIQFPVQKAHYDEKSLKIECMRKNFVAHLAQ